MSGRIRIVASSEVSVIRTNNCVLLSHLNILPIPLSNTRSTSICKNNTTNILKIFDKTVTLNCSTNLLTSRSYSKNWF
uniref:Candidate secreted effector n=1 Tax=Meloidogyne incognita TaxID=6306 RepID=A0A914MS23_MELIC